MRTSIYARLNGQRPARRSASWRTTARLSLGCFTTPAGVSRAANTQALWEEAERLNVTLVEDLDFRRDALSALDSVLTQADRVYLTVDLDVLPAAEMPAVSAPAALGIPALDLFPVIERICRSGKLQAADLVEFNPHYDRDGQGRSLPPDWLANCSLVGITTFKES